MLNLSQVKHQVKFSPTALVPNPANLLGLNECYRQLKQLGWISTDEVHKTARVSTFTLGGATIHYDRTAKAWQVEVAGGILTRQGDLATITAEAASLDAQTDAPRPMSLAAQHAAILTAEYPALATRIAAGLALAEAGVAEFPKYGTTFDPITYHGCYSCDCPDSVNRKPVAKFGKSCKHCLAMEINRRVKSERKATAYRRLSDKLDLDRARRLATQGSYDAVLKPDRINRKAPHYAQHNGIGHR